MVCIPQLWIPNCYNGSHRHRPLNSFWSMVEQASVICINVLRWIPWVLSNESKRLSLEYGQTNKPSLPTVLPLPMPMPMPMPMEPFDTMRDSCRGWHAFHSSKFLIVLMGLIVICHLYVNERALLDFCYLYANERALLDYHGQTYKRMQFLV